MSKKSMEECKAFIETFHLKEGSGPLDGLTFAVKDNIDIKGFKSGYGNPTWQKTHPIASAHAICVEQILQAGAECLGKTIMSELAFAIDGENHFYGTPLNANAPDRLPGGSSSGSASAVACKVVDFALGTDAGGSVRVPASNCGVFGMRPSHGSISITGLCPFASTFDTVGFFAKDAETLYKVGKVLFSFEDSKQKLGNIYLIKEAFALCDEDVTKALEKPVAKLKELYGSSVKEISFHELLGFNEASDLKHWLETFITIQWSEIWTALGSWIESTRPEFGPRTKLSFELAKNIDRSNLSLAIAKREKIFRKLKTVLKPNDLLCFPTTPAFAPIKGSLGLDRSKGNYFPRIFSLTSIASLGRLPEVTLPVSSGNIPIGLSLLGANGSNQFLLQFAREVASNL